jgi:transcriptional regulator with XRE-family HTH domain
MRHPRNLITASRLGSDRNGRTSHAGADSPTISTSGRTRSAVITTRCQRDEGRISPERPDPEVLAGQALRRLRLSRGWSQEEVAKRMQSYSYDFHQTMIAKIEAAQRPLRVRELADFAALYGVQVNDLIYLPSVSLDEIDEEIEDLEAQVANARQMAAAADEDRNRARMALERAEALYHTHVSILEALSGRLSFLRTEREKSGDWQTRE